MVALPSKVHINWWKFNCLRLARWLVMKLELKPTPLVIYSPFCSQSTCWEKKYKMYGGSLSSRRWCPIWASHDTRKKTIKLHSIAIIEEVGCLYFTSYVAYQGHRSLMIYKNVSWTLQTCDTLYWEKYTDFLFIICFIYKAEISEY